MVQENKNGEKYEDGKYYYYSARNALSTIVSKYNDIVSGYEYLTNKLEQLNNEQQDLLHYIEFSNLDIVRSYKVLDKLKNVRIERRFVKNELESMSVAYESLKFMKNNIHQVSKAQGRCNKLENNHFNRSYYVRSKNIGLDDFEEQMEKHNKRIEEMTIIK